MIARAPARAGSFKELASVHSRIMSESRSLHAAHQRLAIPATVRSSAPRGGVVTLSRLIRVRLAIRMCRA